MKQNGTIQWIWECEVITSGNGKPLKDTLQELDNTAQKIGLINKTSKFTRIKRRHSLTVSDSNRMV